MYSKAILLFIIVQISYQGYSQTSGSITVGGDLDKFYPVTWLDVNWATGQPTEVYIARPDVHGNSTWRGSLMSYFTFHTTQWGHGSHYINSRVFHNVVPFIAGWRDVTNQNSNMRIVIWLRGGGTSYYFSSSVAVDPQVYDGVQNSLPYQETNGPAHSYKTTVDDYINSFGSNEARNSLSYGSGYFLENVGIGTTDTKGYRLAIAGKGVAEELVVKIRANWPDYVFENNYKLPSLSELETFIKSYKHLPDVPTADEVKEDGLSLGEMNAILLKKVEELTLHVIEQSKRIEEQQKENEAQNEVIKKLLKKNR